MHVFDYNRNLIIQLILLLYDHKELFLISKHIKKYLKYLSSSKFYSYLYYQTKEYRKSNAYSCKNDDMISYT